MRTLVHLETFSPRSKVMLHAWDPGGDIRDVQGTSTDNRLFTFDLEMETADPREVQFKFWFPDDPLHTWESDAYTRRIPTVTVAELWCFEYSRRCMTADPNAGVAVTQVTIHALSRRRFAGGFVHAWEPAGHSFAQFDLGGTASDPLLWSCVVPLQPWMLKGFHFKLARRQEQAPDFEPDESTRVWRPNDGGEVWVKSGQHVVLPARPMPQAARVELTYSRRAAVPSLVVRDDVDDFSSAAMAGEATGLDEGFAQRSYAFDVYPEAGYRVSADIVENGAATTVLSLPFRASQGDALTVGRAIVGNYRWLDAPCRRDAIARVVVYPNPQSTFSDSVLVRWRPGEAPRALQDPPMPGCQTSIATRRSDGAWQVELAVFSGVPHWVDLLSSSDGTHEVRRDGQTVSRRSFQIPSGRAVELSTVDGLTGFSTAAVQPKIADVPSRIDWLKKAYSESIVDAGVFDPWELPLGATPGNQEILFTLFAPHAVVATLLLLEHGDGDGPARKCRSVEMQLTPDLRYWWCTVPNSSLPDPGRIWYRFQLNGSQEVIDPASRLVSAAPFLFAAPDEGPEGAWSIVADRHALRAEAGAAAWQTPPWSDLLIYELHPLRFTNRNRNGNRPLPAFEQISRELAPGGYLDELGVAALELLPVHEFPKEISWGYNPSLHFAVESSYGGPSGFAAMVRQAHSRQKGVMLDLVLNHLVESPMQEIAPDVFVDGETNWGDMVNYDHPVVREHFRQALVYLWDTYLLDGFRLDATLAIVKSDVENGYILRRPGSGHGWEFLVMLRRALREAADACGRRWPYLVAENDPNDWAINGNADSGAVDGQWDFDLQYRIGSAARNLDDNIEAVKDVLIPYRPPHETVRYAESHDAVSAQEAWKQRMVRREAWGFGMSMAKATGAVVLLAKGIPMLFMGEEAGEEHPFAFHMAGLEDKQAYLDLDFYLNTWGQSSHVLRWYQDLIGLRRNKSNGFAADDRPFIGRGRKTLAFTRADGRFFVVATFGTPDTVQNLGWLGLPAAGSYKEVFNSTWPQYAVDKEIAVQNAGYGAALTAWDNVSLPAIGAVVLERR